MIDLNQLDLKSFASKGVEIQLKHPISGEPLDSFISIKGADSSEYKNAMIDLSKSKADGIESNYDKDGAGVLASITVDWRGLSFGDDEISFSHDAAIDLYARFEWIANQVFAACNDRKLFLVNAEPS